ncbi:hypothetical protein BDB00DRAFT_829134 [Zychaea mexicana]|uniref:uncharacterized protein n=1 Tax=Zychaea mexicana TaxID=64656 RepID=UPI0022FDFC8A|nr:uncharacterized protein BDB00DRAFT_829134 [Zychaea mexicana]KAI9492277.1 hypothetical protein BDB00DRAFT_829134 [Zychaea mexicana]
MSVVVPYHVQPIAATANGIFAGLGLTLNGVTIPALRVGGYPVASWAVTYKNGSKIGIATIFISSAAHFYTYYLTKNRRALYCGIASLISFPYTLIFMKPTNDRLHELNANPAHDQKEVVGLVEKWDKLQMFRTGAGLAALWLTLF